MILNIKVIFIFRNIIYSNHWYNPLNPQKTNLIYLNIHIQLLIQLLISPNILYNSALNIYLLLRIFVSPATYFIIWQLIISCHVRLTIILLGKISRTFLGIYQILSKCWDLRYTDT